MANLNIPCGFGTAPVLARDDFLTDRIVIIAYPQGAGGKFLANCLGLDPDALLQDMDLAMAQIQGNFHTKQKLDIVCGAYDEIQQRWNDANLGCEEFFGIDQCPGHASRFFKPELSHWLDYDPRLRLVIDSGKTFFLMAHQSEELEWYLKIWPNARVIWFRNHSQFRQHHRPHFLDPIYQMQPQLNQWWDKNRQTHWPLLAPSCQESLQQSVFRHVLAELDPAQKLELSRLLPHEQYFQEFVDIDAKQIAYISQNRDWHRAWDGDWYLDQDQLLSQLQDLYHALDLEYFDHDALGRLYRCWMSALRRYAQQSHAEVDASIKSI